MFEKMVESAKQTRRSGVRRSLLAVSSIVVTSSVAFAILFSLYNHTLAMGSEPGDLVRLLPPVLSAERPEQAAKQEIKSAPENAKSVLPERTDHVQRTDEQPSKAPDSVSTVPSTVRARPLSPYIISGRNSDPPAFGQKRGGTEPGGGFAPTDAETNDGAESEKSTAGNEPVAAPPKLERRPEYIGVLNGRAVHLDIPEYPAIAKQMGVKGQVKVQVLIDEDGTVVSASVAEGPSLLRRAALQSAKASRFSPTYLNNNKVSVRGIIIYNFK